MHFSRILTKFAASAALGTGLLVAGAAAAQAGEIDHRVDHQQARINAGVRHGDLSRHEAIRADRRLSRIEYERNHDMRRHHGHLTPRERARINRQLSQNSRTIHRDRHDWNRR